MRPLMDTDSEQLMLEGINTGVATFSGFLSEANWRLEDIDKTVCHQVGLAHRKRMLESLAIDPRGDFATVETLGNTGSVALPISLAIGIEQGWLQQDDKVALLGIGSGINCVMIAVDWQTSRVLGESAAAYVADASKIDR